MRKVPIGGFSFLTVCFKKSGLSFSMNLIISLMVDKTTAWKLHSKRVKKSENYTRNEWRSLKITLETSRRRSRLIGMTESSSDALNDCLSLRGAKKSHSFRVYLVIFSTRFECIWSSSLLVSSVVFLPWKHVVIYKFCQTIKYYHLIPLCTLRQNG